MMFWARKHTHSYQHLYRSHNLVWDPSIHWTYLGHCTLEEAMENKGVLREWWDSCYKFGWVRNTSRGVLIE